MTLAGLWGVVATVIALLPQRTHWAGAYGLMVAGIPVLGFVWWQNGWPWAALVLLGMASVLRWPARFAWAWVRKAWSRGDG